MYQCIMSSLSEVGKKTIANENDEYTEANIKSGPLLYKVITSKAIVDNRSTTNHLRYQLGALDTYIFECGNDILKFNQYVQGLELSLKAREEKAEDLNLNLFTGYEACSDEKFRQYISKKRDDYEDGTNPNLTTKQLITYAEKKFNTMKRDHKWNSLSSDQ